MMMEDGAEDIINELDKQPGDWDADAHCHSRVQLLYEPHLDTIVEGSDEGTSSATSSSHTGSMYFTPAASPAVASIRKSPLEKLAPKNVLAVAKITQAAQDEFPNITQQETRRNKRDASTKKEIGLGVSKGAKKNTRKPLEDVGNCQKLEMGIQKELKSEKRKNSADDKLCIEVLEAENKPSSHHTQQRDLIFNFDPSFTRLQLSQNKSPGALTVLKRILTPKSKSGSSTVKKRGAAQDVDDSKTCPQSEPSGTQPQQPAGQSDMDLPDILIHDTPSKDSQLKDNEKISQERTKGDTVYYVPSIVLHDTESDTFTTLGKEKKLRNTSLTYPNVLLQDQHAKKQPLKTSGPNIVKVSSLPSVSPKYSTDNAVSKGSVDSSGDVYYQASEVEIRSIDANEPLEEEDLRRNCVSSPEIRDPAKHIQGAVSNKLQMGKKKTKPGRLPSKDEVDANHSPVEISDIEVVRKLSYDSLKESPTLSLSSFDEVTLLSSDSTLTHPVESVEVLMDESDGSGLWTPFCDQPVHHYSAPELASSPLHSGSGKSKSSGPSKIKMDHLTLKHIRWEDNDVSSVNSLSVQQLNASRASGVSSVLRELSDMICPENPADKLRSFDVTTRYMSPRKALMLNVLSLILLAMSYFSVGVSIAIVGPLLSDLSRLWHSTLEDCAQLVTSRGVGMHMGYIIVLCCYNRMNHYVLVFFMLLLCGCTHIVFPSLVSYAAAMIIIFIQGISLGILFAAISLSCYTTVNLIGSKTIQLVHFMYGAGILLAPFIALPALRGNIPAYVPNALSNFTINNSLQYNESLTGMTSLPQDHLTVDSLISDSSTHSSTFDVIADSTAEIILDTATQSTVVGQSTESQNDLLTPDYATTSKEILTKLMLTCRDCPEADNSTGYLNSSTFQDPSQQYVDSLSQNDSSTILSNSAASSVTGDPLGYAIPSYTSALNDTSTMNDSYLSKSTLLFCPYYTNEPIREECQVYPDRLFIVYVALMVLAFIPFTFIFIMWFVRDQPCCTNRYDLPSASNKMFFGDKVLMISSILVHFIVGGFEIMYGFFLSTYIMLYFHQDVEPTVYVMCLCFHYTFYTIGRFIGGLVLQNVKARYVFIINTFVLSANMVGEFYIAGVSELLLRFSSCLLGLCLSTLMTSVTLWIEEYVQLHRLQCALFIGASGLGMIAVPAVAGYTISTWGMFGYDVLKMTLALLLFVICLVMMAYERCALTSQSPFDENNNITAGITSMDYGDAQRAARRTRFSAQYYMMSCTAHFVRFFALDGIGSVPDREDSSA